MARTIQVLVIDGDRLNCALLRNILENEGLQVLDASGARLGWQILRAAPCDLVITDLLITDPDGGSVLEVLLREFPETRIIALTRGGGGRSRISEREEQAFRGVVRILERPVFRQELLTAIQELFPDWQPEESHGERHGL
ncbi:MAG: response regulator [Magnetococcales bacterium]|nr:response regulator [Magnetococcales bacterium]